MTRHRPVGQMLDLVYPRFCPGCEVALPRDQDCRLCISCRDNLARIQPPFCELCGEKFHGELAQSFRCNVCIDRPPAFDFARAAYHSHELVRDVIHQFKYERRMHLSPLLAEWLEEGLTDRRLARQDWLLVPVPLHRRRKRQRHFNQAEELCMLLAAARQWRWVNALRRIRYTTPQAHLERSDRLTNLEGAFALSPWRRQTEMLRGASVLLVDDVVTTGSTAHECAKILKEQAGAAKVAVLTVARAGTPARS